MLIKDHFFQKLKAMVECPPIKNKSIAIFSALKEPLIQLLLEIIHTRKHDNKGPKPNKEIISKVLDAIIENLDSGTKIRYLETHYGIKRSTYYRYLNLIINYGLFEKIHQQLLNCKSSSLLIVDGSHIRSISGSEGVGYGYKERSKRAIKLTILIDTKKVIQYKGLQPDNLTDHKAFLDMVKNNPQSKPIEVLADAGYHGKEFFSLCRDNGYNVTSCIRKTRNGFSHTLTNYQKIMLKRERNKVEHVFAQLKTFRGIRTKSNKKVKFYNLLLELGVLLISINNGIINGGLRVRKIFLRKKDQ